MTRAGGVAVSLAVGIGLAACSSASSSSSTSAQASADATTTAAASATAAASTAAASTGSASTASASAAAAAAPGKCQTADLRVALGASSGTSQPTQTVTLTNEGSSACTMVGFPGVNLYGSSQGVKDYQWPLRRASQSYSKVTLQPGGTAHFGLVYLPAESGNIILQVTKVIITPPNEYTSTDLSWSKGIILQDGATHPGTFITPVVSGA
jgi:Protein of unknown function (DUF4232)